MAMTDKASAATLNIENGNRHCGNLPTIAVTTRSLKIGQKNGRQLALDLVVKNDLSAKRCIRDG